MRILMIRRLVEGVDRILTRVTVSHPQPMAMAMISIVPSNEAERTEVILSMNDKILEGAQSTGLFVPSNLREALSSLVARVADEPRPTKEADPSFFELTDKCPWDQHWNGDAFGGDK